MNTKIKCRAISPGPTIQSIMLRKCLSPQCSLSPSPHQQPQGAALYKLMIQSAQLIDQPHGILATASSNIDSEECKEVSDIEKQSIVSNCGGSQTYEFNVNRSIESNLRFDLNWAIMTTSLTRPTYKIKSNNLAYKEISLSPECAALTLKNRHLII